MIIPPTSQEIGDFLLKARDLKVDPGGGDRGLTVARLELAHGAGEPIGRSSSI